MFASPHTTETVSGSGRWDRPDLAGTAGRRRMRSAISWRLAGPSSRRRRLAPRSGPGPGTSRSRSIPAERQKEFGERRRTRPWPCRPDPPPRPRLTPSPAPRRVPVNDEEQLASRWFGRPPQAPLPMCVSDPVGVTGLKTEWAAAPQAGWRSGSRRRERHRDHGCCGHVECPDSGAACWRFRTSARALGGCARCRRLPPPARPWPGGRTGCQIPPRWFTASEEAAALRTRAPPGQMLVLDGFGDHLIPTSGRGR